MKRKQRPTSTTARILDPCPAYEYASHRAERAKVVMEDAEAYGDGGRRGDRRIAQWRCKAGGGV